MANKKIKRRELMFLLTNAGALSITRSPLALFMANIASSLIVREALGAPNSNRKWVDFRTGGAPARWVYDIFMNPLNQNNFASNPQMATRYVESGGRFTDVEYATFTHAGIQVPWLWQFPLPRPGGGTQPMTDLLTHMLQIRGLNTANAGHSGSEMKHFIVPAAVQSASALSTDAGEAPFPAVITRNGVIPFKSKENFVPTFVTGTNLIQSLMEPFLTSASDNSAALRGTLRDYLKSVSMELNTQAINSHSGFRATASALNNVQQIIQVSVNNLATEWQVLLDKYKSLIARVLVPTTSLQGINNIPIGTTGSRGATYSTDGAIKNHPDLRTMIDGSTRVGNLAEIFALAEYILLNDLSDSITLGSPSLIQLANEDGSRFNHNNDEHGSGKMTSLLINTFYHRCHAACLLELISQLKFKGIFENVVIRNGSEFNRSPRGNGSGSDHGFQGASMAFYSGAIRGPFVIGNIQASGNSTYPGTWGISAPVASSNSHLNGVNLDFGHVLSSIATMLKVPTPITSREPLVTETSNGIVPTIERGKII
jgi:hypothetical protein